MIIKARINGEGGKVYKLCEWNTLAFSSDPSLKLQTDDLNEVKETFQNISKIEIYQANTLICEYTLYDTYSSIQYVGEVYVAHENIFADCLQITLHKESLVEQVQKIQDKLENNVDIDSMTIDEYRDYMKNYISEQCTTDIQAGQSIDLGNGYEMFSYKTEDQQNLLQLYLITKMYPNITQLPYHSSGNNCKFYSVEQIQTIYMTLVTRLLRLTTYANQLFQYLKTLTTKEDIGNCTYGMVLPEPYSTTISNIMVETLEALNANETTISND